MNVAGPTPLNSQHTAEELALGTLHIWKRCASQTWWLYTCNPSIPEPEVGELQLGLFSEYHIRQDIM